MERFTESRANSHDFEVLVVGGGITGAAVAYEAARAGIKTALVEKGDFGGATSAATSKLIHGGLRYLKTMEFGLVRESLKERRILEDIAPNLVYPLAFIMPHYSRFQQWLMRTGLTFYDLLSFDRSWTYHEEKRITAHRSMSRAEVLKDAPILPEKGLVGGALYYDCQSIFPERLTLAFIKSAAAHGAATANYAHVTGFISDGKHVLGAEVRDLISGRDIQVRARLVINSGGPWADRVLDLAAGPSKAGRIRMSEGIHIIVPQLVAEHALVLATPGGRHFFVLPWRGHSLIGTTDKPFEGRPDDYRVTKASIDEFIEDINSTLGQEVVRYDDIVFAYGGLRPLTDSQTEGTYSSSRRYEIFDSSDTGISGLITVEGGKYTTSRHLGASVLKLIETKLGRQAQPSSSERAYLQGCEIRSMEEFATKVATEHPNTGARTRDFLARNFGTEAGRVLKIAATDARLAEPLNADGEILAEVVFAIRHEMAKTLEDVLMRRTGFGTLGLPEAAVLDRIADVAAGELGWDAEERRAEIDNVQNRFAIPGKTGAKPSTM